MKITQSQLRRIIKEEFAKLSESHDDDDGLDYLRRDVDAHMSGVKSSTEMGPQFDPERLESIAEVLSLSGVRYPRLMRELGLSSKATFDEIVASLEPVEDIDKLLNATLTDLQVKEINRYVRNIDARARREQDKEEKFDRMRYGNY